MNHSAKRAADVLRLATLKRGSVADTLPDYARRLRHERNLSLAVVSARSGGKIGKTRINRIENGLVSTSPKDVARPG